MSTVSSVMSINNRAILDTSSLPSNHAAPECRYESDPDHPIRWVLSA
jgi:hypothetical protein